MLNCRLDISLLGLVKYSRKNSQLNNLRPRTFQVYDGVQQMEVPENVSTTTHEDKVDIL